MRIFMSRQGACSTFPQSTSIASVFRGVKRRLLNGNRRRKVLPAERAAREELRHHLALIKTSLGIKNT
jgi:hypothetical protein